MGSHYRVYIGPYLKCITRIVTVEKTINTCSNLECRFRRKHDSIGKKADFCSKCGSPAEKLTFKPEGETRDDIHPHDIDEQTTGTEAALTPWNTEYPQDEGVHLIVPNQWPFDRPYTYGEDYDRTCGMLLDDVPAKVVDETTAFMRLFAVGIEKAHEIYGKPNVKVCWGLLGEFR